MGINGLIGASVHQLCLLTNFPVNMALGTKLLGREHCDCSLISLEGV